MSNSHAPSQRPLAIYGAGGHGLVVAESAEAAGFLVIGFLDDSVTLDRVGRWPVLNDTKLGEADFAVIVGIGDNFARRRLARDMHDAGIPTANVIHPTAWVSPSATVGRGVYIGPNAVVNAEAKIGDGAIINSGAIVEHHCRIGAFSHAGPGAKLGGNVGVGELVLVGLGASVLPNVQIDDDATVGAGAVVIDDVPRGATVVGVPAQPSREKSPATV